METARYQRECSSLEMDESDGQPARAEECERRAYKCDVTFREVSFMCVSFCLGYMSVRFSWLIGDPEKLE